MQLYGATHNTKHIAIDVAVVVFAVMLLLCWQCVFASCCAQHSVLVFALRDIEAHHIKDLIPIKMGE